MNIKEEIKIILIYLLTGISWILFSDKILTWFISNPDQYILAQTYKGWSFVLITSVIFYLLLHKVMIKIRKQKNSLLESYQQVEADNEELKALNEELKALNGEIIEQKKIIKKYHLRQEEFHNEIIFSITNMLEIHDSYTQGHCENVANIAREIAIKLSLSEKEIADAYWAGILHDIGKVLIPKSILNKKGKLKNEEYEIIKKHPEWGYQTIKKSKTLSGIATYVLHHHERWDGNGYPAGLKGNDIPLIASILTLADSYDAMSSSRPYRKALAKEDALNEIIKNRGTQFSPQVCDVFMEIEAGN